MPKLYLFYISCVSFPEYIGKIAALCSKDIEYFDNLRIGYLTNAFNFFSEENDYLLRKNVIDIDLIIYNKVKLESRRSQIQKLYKDKDCYRVLLDGGNYIIKKFEGEENEFFFDRLGIYYKIVV